ncbi:MAG: T9SS type A sorting domain-containing protein [Salinibacter sp.]|uniref:T9SS type A sorting domain-containing protein n=1 Tax=Salinibacter sp. TaxID=2065818 RepID=UPI0035D412B4
MRPLIPLVLFTLFAAPVQAQLPTSLLDNFNRSDSDALGMTPTEPESIQWSEKGEEVGSGTDLTSEETVRIESNTALLQSGAKDGQKWAAVDMSNVSGYPTTLDDASGVVTWAFNMRQNQSNPEGFSAGEHGLMFVLASSSNDFPGSGNAYAIVLGQDGGSDNLKLVSFNGGYGKEGDFADIIRWSADLSTEYLSVRVTFDADNKTWTLYAEKANGGYPRSDPRNVPASAERGTAQNSDLTGDGQKYLGMLWNHGQDDAAQAFFDDLYVTDPSNQLPVEIAAFRASTRSDRVHLRWTTASETENAGFEVRHVFDGTTETIGFVDGGGTTSQPTQYTFATEELVPGTHTFRLIQVDLDGSTTLGPKRVVRIQPQGVELSALGPNPVGTGQPISFRIASETKQPVTVTVHDMLGRTLQTVYDGPIGGQGTTLSVPTTSLSAGVYFLRAQSPSGITTRRVVVLK